MADIKEIKEISSSLTMLYVEDDTEIAQAFIAYLSKIFKEVVYAQNGEEGLELYKQNMFDLVITDINMPKMNGIEMITAIREISKNQHIIIISAHTELDNFTSSIKLGIDGYIIKPINYTDLNNILFKIVQNIKVYKENKINVQQQQALLTTISQNNSQLRQYNEMLNKVAIVSKTDLKGIITYVNDFFCHISGYTEEELIGQNHNIVRHQDMAKSVYKELWHTIQCGQTWTGSIKNKAKNGDPYFVLATVFPMYDVDHKNIVEYMAIRFLTTDEENEKREFHKKVRHTYQEFRKSNFDSVKRIETLEKVNSDLAAEDIYKSKLIETLKMKNKNSLSQIDFLEKEMNKTNENMKVSMGTTSSIAKDAVSNYKRALAKIESQKEDLKFFQKNELSRQKEILQLNEKLHEQREIVVQLRDTIKNGSIKKKEEKKEEKKGFW